MEEEVVVLSPDRLGYKDRGKMKWQGLMLSDHNAALKQMKEDSKKQYGVEKEQMSTEEVSEVLYKAYVMKKPVAIQANVLKNGRYYPDVKCTIKGYSRDNIYLQLKDGQVRKVSIYLIRNVEFMNPTEWYVKRDNKKRTDY